MLRLFVALVVLGLALACITSWVLDGYDTAWHPKRSLQHRTGDGVGSRGSSPPFPGGEMNNIFWFIQVSGCPHIHLIFLSLPLVPRPVAAGGCIVAFRCRRNYDVYQFPTYQCVFTLQFCVGIYAATIR